MFVAVGCLARQWGRFLVQQWLQQLNCAIYPSDAERYLYWDVQTEFPGRSERHQFQLGVCEGSGKAQLGSNDVKSAHVVLMARILLCNCDQ